MSKLFEELTEQISFLCVSFVFHFLSESPYFVGVLLCFNVKKNSQQKNMSYSFDHRFIYMLRASFVQHKAPRKHFHT